MNVLESNRLIADFMGAVFHDHQNEWYDWDGLYMGESLRFYESWDWLMPVIEKIESLGFYFRFLGKGWIIIVDLGETETIEIFNASKLQAAYEAVVSFIQWYNEQKEK